MQKKNLTTADATNVLHSNTERRDGALKAPAKWKSRVRRAAEYPSLNCTSALRFPMCSSLDGFSGIFATTTTIKASDSVRVCQKESSGSRRTLSAVTYLLAAPIFARVGRIYWSVVRYVSRPERGWQRGRGRNRTTLALNADFTELERRVRDFDAD